MKQGKPQNPPRLANKFLEWYCRPEILEDLQGDLYEHFDRNIIKKGYRKARAIYWLDVLKFFRLYTIKKLNIFNNITTFIMFKNYFKISVRSISRNKLFSAINVIGLAISMSIGLLMIVFISEIFSFDKFHKDGDRIYRVNNIYKEQQEDPTLFGTTSIIMNDRIKENIPGIESQVLMTRNFGGDAKIDDKIIPIRGFWASEGFNDVFSFEILQGNPKTMLTKPNSVVLTDETAQKLFGDSDPLNQTFIIGDNDIYTVTGVIKKPPYNSHFTFQALASYSTYIIKNGQGESGERWFSAWNNMWMNYVYVKLQPNTKAQDINQRLVALGEKESEKSERFTITAELQPLYGMMAGPQLSNNIGSSIGGEIVWILGALTIVVLLSAGFNYTNLSIARSLKRAKEVGVRKVVGATKRQIFNQFITESTIISIIALFIAYILFMVIKPHFLGLDPSIEQSLRLEMNPQLFIYFIGFSLLVGILAGFFPALFLSKLQAIQALKNSGSTKLFSKVNVRKVLIVVQFTLSMAFIISASIAYTQFKYALGFDLGFKTENVLNVELQENDWQKVQTAFEAIPEIESISKSAMITSIGNTYLVDMKYENDSIELFYNTIDEHYIDLMNHDIIAGSNFSEKSVQSEESEIILNEQALRRFNIGTPNEAIGKQVSLEDETVTIIGIVRDFHYDRLDQGIKSFGFRNNYGSFYFANLKINSTDLPSTMVKIENAWSEVDPIHEFRSKFYDENIEEAYSQYVVMGTIVGFLAVLTISIAALGLLGMAVYTAETRMKEISIRKVLGATEGSLIGLLTRGFMLLLAISASLAIPLTYFFFEQNILEGIENRAPIGPLELLTGVIIIFSIGLLTIGSQVRKAARANPATTLRSE
jgi:ABC-type antimicrobial peptide transport system permease subunit